MDTEFVTITEYCLHHHAEASFIQTLTQHGLLTLIEVEEQQCIPYHQLNDLDQYLRWYYELDINPQGIEVAHHLLLKIKELQQQVAHLQHQVDMRQ